MALATRRTLAALCIALLLAAGAWIVGTLRAPDPRARGAWAASVPALEPGTPVDVTLYLPGCAIRAVRLHAAHAQDATIVTTVVRGPDATGTEVVLSPPETRAFGPGTVIDVPLVSSPARERVRLALTARTPGTVLDATRPISLVPVQPSVLGLLPCVMDGRTDLTLALLALVALHLTGIGWLAGVVIAGTGVQADGTPRRRGAGTLAIGLVATTLGTYAFVVPPFEPPDEFAHLQYARYVAVTGALPREIPPPNSEWRSSVYEWVQQPAYYMLAAGLLRLSGTADAAPAPEPHPQSRLAGGPDVNIYRHPDTTSAPGALRALALLRFLSVLMALGTVWCAVRAVTLATADLRLGAAAGASLALVPQWIAVMGIVSTDPPATLAAALTTLLLCRLVLAPRHWRQAAAVGIATGLAYASKATSVFLIPMAAAALAGVGRLLTPRVAVRYAVAVVAGAMLAAAWIPLRAWVVFGDPLARAFKREVLAIGGFVAIPGPPVLSRAFVDQMQMMVFEPFWARFGSLGAGPLPGTRLWWVYGFITVVLLAVCVTGAAWAARQTWRGADAARDVRRAWLVTVCAVGTVVGVSLWAWVNLVPQDDVIVHWTPRHILPLTVPLLVLCASGLQAWADALTPSARAALRAACGVGLLVLAVAGLLVLRSAALGFHFGY